MANHDPANHDPANPSGGRRAHAAPSRRRPGLLPAALTTFLAAAGIALLAVGCAASRPGPPQPPASAAGTIAPAAAGAPATLSSTAASGAVGVTPKYGRAGSPAPAPRTTQQPTTPPHTTRQSTTAPAPPASSAQRSTAALSSHVTRSHQPPSPTTTHRADQPASGPTVTGPVLPRSAPVELSVPAIGVHSPLLRLGLNQDGTVQVPPLDDPDSKAGWYDRSPEPGTLGPAVILGHVDSAKYGPGVFYRLGDLKPGEHIDVTRADGTVAVFRIDAVRSYSKTDFPTLQVYGNIDHAGLRLITCGGQFDYTARSYDNNIVVYASLQSSHPAS